MGLFGIVGSGRALGISGQTQTPGNTRLTSSPNLLGSPRLRATKRPIGPSALFAMTFTLPLVDRIESR